MYLIMLVTEEKHVPLPSLVSFTPNTTVDLDGSQTEDSKIRCRSSMWPNRPHTPLIIPIKFVVVSRAVRIVPIGDITAWRGRAVVGARAMLMVPTLIRTRLCIFSMLLQLHFAWQLYHLVSTLRIPAKTSSYLYILYTCITLNLNSIWIIYSETNSISMPH